MKQLTAWLAASQDFFHGLGMLGVFAYAVTMALAGLASLPLSPFAITGGLIFGFGKGFLSVQLGTFFSATLNFLVSRHVARGFVQRKLAAHAKFKAIDAAVGREGWKIVALLRFVPMPFGLVNYAFGLTAIRFWPYVLATFFPIILGNVFFVWMGATAQAGIAAASGSGRPRHPMEIVMMALGVVAAFTAMVVVTRIARQAVAQRDETLAAE
jgi:uncharacterized membrane protein YdjX (TVP38/TMEM64 family)